MTNSGSSPDEAEGTYEVLTVKYGTRTTRSSQIFLNFHFYGDQDQPVDMDFFFWVVRNGKRTVIVDTGFTPEVGSRRGRTTTCSPAQALNRLGIDPKSVTHVVLTHCHYDHIGNIGLFPSAELVISKRELEFWSGPYASRLQFAHDVESDDMEQIYKADTQGRLTQTGATHTVVPGIDVIEVGGHTPGQLIVLVQTPRGPVLLASDALHFYDELELDRPFTVLCDLPGMYRSLDEMREIRDSGAVLVAGHDPEVMRRFPAIDPNDADLGVRIA